MPSVQTVSGACDVEDLGVTYMHEHLFLVSPELQHYWPGYEARRSGRASSSAPSTTSG